MSTAQGRPPAPSRRRPGSTAWRRTALAGATCATVLAGLVLPAGATPLPGGLGPCLPGSCPTGHPAAGTGAFAGRDDNVNVFTGGDFRVRGTARAAEGRVVALGAFDLRTTGGDGRYSVGNTGSGTRTPPSDGADFLTTGQALTVAPGRRLEAARGTVRHAGPATGTVLGRSVTDPAAARPYARLRQDLAAASRCYARGADGHARRTTGTARNTGAETVFTGDGRSALQVFDVGFDLTGPGGAPQGIRFTAVPPSATVLVNLTGPARVVSVRDGAPAAGPGRLRERLLWNLPDAGRADFRGPGQFQGSVLAGNPAGESTVRAAGMNGRFYTAGSLTHTSGPGAGGAPQFHALPFTGDLPSCGAAGPAAAQVRGQVTVVKKDAATGRPLAGARFQLWRETNRKPGLQAAGPGADRRAGAVCVTDARGTCRRAVDPGTYYWQEVQAPPGYLKNAVNVTRPFALTTGNAARGITVTVADPRAPLGTIRLVKRNTRTGRPLQGAVFELWRETNGRPGLQTTARADLRVVAGCATDPAGRCTFPGLPLGTYYLRETAVPEGFRLTAARVFGPYRLTTRNVTAGLTATIRNTPGEPAKGKG
ncbi:hypothetical protein GCM10010218_46380 [Streptomyces mashuensis]|uniref:Uncharacterized protein n=1 Tax=Streptomyces mashuensis TaxID=33904 RepID=A0A919B752_9ACTN|nr:choice-of-anchor A family protein [Streptomyces mashuensis]GHF59555.1 hypothetical protein GCM10010218_46380 [Streptomyces mashuensis]